MPAATKDEKIVRNFSDVPLLEELDLPGLLTRHHELEMAIAAMETEKGIIAQGIRVCVDAAEADTVVYTDTNNQVWRSTVVRPEPSKKVIRKSLEKNMMKMGKLDAKTVGAIFAASTKTGDPRDPYVRITDPYLPKKKKEADDGEETE